VKVPSQIPALEALVILTLMIGSTLGACVADEAPSPVCVNIDTFRPGPSIRRQLVSVSLP
jgi:hypothetical protein